MRKRVFVLREMRRGPVRRTDEKHKKEGQTLVFCPPVAYNRDWVRTNQKLRFKKFLVCADTAIPGSPEKRSAAGRAKRFPAEGDTGGKDGWNG